MAEAVRTTGLLVEEFGVAQITPLRHAVSRAAFDAGLSGPRLEDFVLAVNEIVTNAVRHAGGWGRLRMWVTTDVVACEVTDRGEGIPRDRLNGHDLPPSHAVSGRGLFLARHLVDEVTVVSTGGSGTIVRLSSALHG